MSNKYKKRSKISEAKFREIVRLFILDIEATKIAAITGLSRNTINSIINGIRKRISQYCETQSPFPKGEIEIDESYFGARRVRGKRGRGAHGKHLVFGLIKRQGKVYTQVVTNCSASVLIPIIKSKVGMDSKIYTDGFKTYDGLVNFGYKKHHRINHSNNEFAKGKNHINGIENFWSIAKTRLSKYRGISKQIFYLHLKECEFRFNHRDDDLYKLVLKIIRKNHL